MSDQPISLHATLIMHTGIGCLLLGPSGSGKSRLAAEMMVLGGKVVADDNVTITMRAGMLMGGIAPNLAGIVEMRGVGLYKAADPPSQQVIHLAIELGERDERLPARVTRNFHGIEVPIIKLPSPPETNALYLLATMRAVHEGRILPPDWRPGA